MNWGAIGAIGEILDWLQVAANIGILAGLILVGLQMQQNFKLSQKERFRRTQSKQAPLSASSLGGYCRSNIHTWRWSQSAGRCGALT